MTKLAESPEIIGWIDFLKNGDGSSEMVIRRAERMNGVWIFYQKNQNGKWVEFESAQDLIGIIESARWP